MTLESEIIGIIKKSRLPQGEWDFLFGRSPSV